MDLSYTVILIILVALLFDFLNGMNDAANSIATGFAIPAGALASALVLWLLQILDLQFPVGRAL